MSNDGRQWKIQVQTVAQYGRQKGKLVWGTLVEGPGGRDQMMEWVNNNKWIDQFIPTRVVFTEDIDC